MDLYFSYNNHIISLRILIGILINILLKTEIGLIGLVFTLAGTIGGISASLVVDTQVGNGEVPKYDLFIKLFMTIGMLALVLYI